MKNKMLDDIENIGIMQGFMDVEDELEDEEDLDEAAEQTLNRRPDSPEILMNTLRGDMRSVDARRQELADLVGDQAAEETPDAVLAMLQPVLAQGGGLGALPQSGPVAEGPQAPMPMPAPPGGPMAAAPPGGMPPMPPPMEAAMGAPPAQDGGIAALMGAGAPPGGGQAPINMARGGLVGSFSDGSDEEGETPFDEEDDASAGGFYSPEMVGIAQEGIQSLLSARPTPEVDVRKEAMEREKLYQDLLGGGDDSARKAQLLFSLAQTGLQFAGNVDAQGRRLTGSPASRFAAAAASIPANINQFIADKEKDRRTVRLAAIQAAEKEAEQVREGNLKQIESKRKLFGDILRNAKKDGASGLFGKGAWDWNIINTPGLLQAYADGETTAEEDNLITSAASRLLRPTTEMYKNEQGQNVTRTIPGYDLPFLTEALAQRKALNAAPRTTPTTPGAVITVPTDAGGAGGAMTEGAPESATAAAPSTEGEVPTAGETAFAEPTLWEAAQAGIGFVPKVGSELARRFPLEFAGELGRTQQQAVSTIEKLAPRVAIALRETTRLAEAEREAINMYLNIQPMYFENRVGYLNNLISLGQVLYRIRNDALDKASDRTLDVTDANNQRFKAREIQSIINMVGIPQPIGTVEEFQALPVGTKFLRYDAEQQAWVSDTRKPLPGEPGFSSQ